MESKLLELARKVLNDQPFRYGYNWDRLKNEVERLERLNSQTTYTPQGESLEFAQPRKPLAYEA